jgi:23S rRNA U2552 (ribose-2'-O)-methylase RlmE/FtsJ
MEIYQINIGDSEILLDNNLSNVIMSSTINIPLISLGFHHFYHKSKDIFKSKINNLKSENDFYYIINPFEYKIPNYEDSLIKVTNQYLNSNLDDIPVKFYKLWEILYVFNLASKKDQTYISLNDDSKGFIQAFTNYKQKFGPLNSKDNIYSNNKKNKQYADLITADGELVWDNDLYQEQESYELIINEIISALKLQNKSGDFILKIYELFTITSIKLIYLLSSFYTDAYIYKPYLSRTTDSEKYIVCKGFIYDQVKDSKILNTKITSLENILKNIDTNKYIYDIFPNLTLPDSYINKIKFINIKFVNQQYIMIHNIIKYIKDNNYYGDKYHAYRDKQITATKWWISMFFPPSKNLFEQNKNELEKQLNHYQEKNTMDFTNFISLLAK